MTNPTLDRRCIDPDRFVLALQEMELHGMAGRIALGVA